MHIRKEAKNDRVRTDARDLPNVVELGEMPAPARELFARFPVIENRHPCAVFFNDMARCYGSHLEAAERSGLFRELDPAATRDAMDFFKKEFPRHAIGGSKRFDLYARYLLALQEVRDLATGKKVPAEATVRFMDAAATLVDAIRRAKLP